MGTEIRGLREDELQVHDELIHESYKEYVTEGRPFLSDGEWWLHCIRHDPYYRPEQTRVMLVDGQMVASVSNYRREVYFTGRKAIVGAIGSVATHPDHRRKGYARRVLAESREWMNETQFDFSFLFGREDVYGGSGWRMLSAFNTQATIRPPRNAYGLDVRQAVFPDDAPVLCAIYHEFDEALVGPIVRTHEYWEKRVPGGYFRDNSQDFFIVEEAGDPVAYFRSTGPGTVPEMGWRRIDPDLPGRVLGAMLARWPDTEEINFGFFTSELAAALVPYTWATTHGEQQRRAGSVQLTEAYKGLWTYIGPGRGHFPEVTDTDSLLRLLRESEYVFWSGVDSF